MQETDEEKVFRLVVDWRLRLFKQYGVYFFILIPVLSLFFLMARFSLDEIFTKETGPKLDDYSVESIVVTVVIAAVVACAIGLPRNPESQAEIRARANVISLGLISRVITIVYPLYPIFLLCFTNTDEFRNFKTWERLFISAFVAAILVALVVVIEEFELYKWEKKKRREDEKRLFLKLFEEREDGTEENYCESRPKRPSNIYLFGAVLLFAFCAAPVLLGGISINNFSPFDGMWSFSIKVFLFIFAIFLLTIMRIWVESWAARKSGVIWIRKGEKVTETEGYRQRWEASKRKTMGDDRSQYWFTVITSWSCYVALSLTLVLSLVDSPETDSLQLDDTDAVIQFWVALGVGVGTIFSIPFIFFALRRLNKNCAFDAFSFIEEIKSSKSSVPKYGEKNIESFVKENPHLCVPKVKWTTRIFYPAKYRQFAVNRVLEILNGERVKQVESAPSVPEGEKNAESKYRCRHKLPQKELGDTPDLLMFNTEEFSFISMNGKNWVGKMDK